jgi:GNAT superfamily N-acetyltransferase
MSDDVEVLLRLATDDDVPAIERLIQASIRGLFPGAYDDRATAAAARHVGHVDRALIEDGTFFVIVEDGDLLACGGWSRRQFVGQAGVAAADRVAFDPTVEAAHIRSIFTRPDRVREGLASQILAACEAAVRSSGFRWLTLRASVPGIPLYARHGYLVTDRFVEPLDDGIAIEVATMVKMLVDSEGGTRP